MSEQSGKRDGDRRDNLGRLLNRRYGVVMAILVALLLLNQLVVQPALLQLMVDAPTINVAGRQRMFSQRIAKAALAADRATDPRGKALHLAELADVTLRWTEAHEGLGRALESTSALGRPSDWLRRSFAAVEPAYRHIKAAADRMIRPEGTPATRREDLGAILANEGAYLKAMDEFVGLYEHETRGRVDRLLLTGWVLTGLIVVILLGIGLVILRPAARTIEQQFRSLARARDEMEDRVRERTRSLEELNERLQNAVEERARVEARHREMLESFSHEARTNTLGEMASGLAHELNQPLGAIANYAEGCLLALDSPEPDLGEIRGVLDRILATTLRAGQIIKRIRRFVTRRGPGLETFEASPLVEEVADLLHPEAQRRGVALLVDLAPDLPSLRGDPIQIQQVLINLVRNAFDAVASAEPPRKQVVMRTRTGDIDGVEFHVEDAGEGIPSDRLNRVFDAYYSTRAEGMGMGLAISRTIVESHQGKIRVDSTPGVKTTFRFLIPASGAECDD